MSTDPPSPADPTLDRGTDHITTSTRDPGKMIESLQQWLAGKLEEDLPESVARQFRND